MFSGQLTTPDRFSYHTGVTGQNIPTAELYAGLKRPRLDYTRVYYGLGQFIPRGILWPNYTPMISITIPIVLSDILKNYLIFQQVTEDLVLSGKLSETAKLTELKS